MKYGPLILDMRSDQWYSELPSSTDASGPQIPHALQANVKNVQEQPSSTHLESGPSSVTREETSVRTTDLEGELQLLRQQVALLSQHRQAPDEILPPAYGVE